MLHLSKATVFLGICTAFLCGTPISAAGLGGIHDNAGFFSEATKSEATRNIDQIERRFRKDLVIETFKEIPPEFKMADDAQDKTALNRVYAKWALQQARNLRVNGVYILMTKEPAHLYVEVGNATQ